MRSAERAFSLVELLVCTVIIAVLAMLSLSAVQSVRATAHDTKCVSNLRQIGSGILQYAHDHDSVLPGPLKVGIYPYWRDAAALGFIIKDYLQIDPRVMKRREDVMLCPTYAQVVNRDYSAIPTFVVNIQVRMNYDEELHQPFGHPSKKFGPVTIRENAPMRLTDLSHIVDENGLSASSRTWAFKDIDRYDDMVAQTAFFRDDLPDRMLHGTHRNALFFDFHVGRIDRDEKPL